MTKDGDPPNNGALPGTSLYDGQFTITRPVRRNGLARVYGAKDTLGRNVFLKVCSDRPFWEVAPLVETDDPSGSLESPTRQVGFVLQEAHCLSASDHPNIIAFHDVFGSGSDLGHGHCLGTPLRQVIDDPDRQLLPEDIVLISWIMLDAVSSIHSLGLIHGDVSVDNILLDAAGEPYLIDFGAVRRSCAVSSGVEETAPGLDEPWRDLQALAVTLHHAITGKPLASADTLYSAPTGPAPRPKLAGTIAGYPRGFLESIDTALEGPSAASFQSADDWLAELERVLSQKDSNMKLLEKALGLRRSNRATPPDDPLTTAADTAPPSPDAAGDPAVSDEPPLELGADLALAVSADLPAQSLQPQQLIQEGLKMAIDLSGLKEITGFIAGCLVDCDSGLMLASELVGKFDIETAAAANVDVVRGKQNAVRLLGLNDSIEDILITLSSQFHLIRPLEGAPNLFLYAALDRKVANLGMARLQVKKVEQSIQF
ncbi:MAG: protein kinase [Tabrizicola sp.]|nr:protein kinase [Tabrizicola sp.]